MAKLIDGDAITVALLLKENEPLYQHIGEDWRCGLSLANEIVLAAPTVDAAEVVRCKDCRYYSPDTLTCTLCYSPIPPSPNWYSEDFCSYGERKDNES